MIYSLCGCGREKLKVEAQCRLCLRVERTMAAIQGFFRERAPSPFKVDG